MLKKPMFLTLVLSGIPAIVTILSVAIQTLTGTKIPFIVFATDIACILWVSWLYLNKYNEPIPKEIRSKTAIYCASLSTIFLLSILAIMLFVKLNSIYIAMFVCAIILVASIRFTYIYFGLAIASRFLINRRNYINNNNDTPKSDLEPDEKIVFRANKKFTLGSLISFIIGFGLWYIIFRFQAHSLWYEVSGGKLILIGGIIGSIAMFIDYQFIADFIVTNKRIIFKRIYYFGKVKDILLDDIESMSSKTRFNKGIITVVSKKVFSLRSITLLNPEELQKNIENYLLELKTDSSQNHNQI